MKNFRTILAALLMLCCATLSAHNFEVDGIFYNILSEEDRTVEVTYKGAHYSDYNEYIGEVTIPANVTYNGTTYSVTTIGNAAFQYCTSLTSIEIPNSVTTIGDYAFYQCNRLTSVTIGNSVTTIEDMAFCYCYELTSITSLIPADKLFIPRGWGLSRCAHKLHALRSRRCKGNIRSYRGLEPIYKYSREYQQL